MPAPRPATLQKYVLKEFLRRFLPALVVLFFIFVLQTFWVYFDELAGKGLSMGTIFKFFYYFSPNILLYALPLSILIAGLMTYGNLGENSELAAVKAAGISLWRSMGWLLIFNLFLAVVVLIIANTLQPVGNQKFTELRTAILHKMPSAVIRQGMFSEIGDFNIKVARKYGPDKRQLEDVIIHQEVNGIPEKIITARHGEFINDNVRQILQLRLTNGQYFEDLTRQQRTSKDRKQLPAVDSRFKTYVINIDLSKMNSLNERKSRMRIYHMLNSAELIRAIDSLQQKLERSHRNFLNELHQRHTLAAQGTKSGQGFRHIITDTSVFTPSALNSILSRAHSKSQVNLNFIKRKIKRFHEQQVFLNKYIHALHEKWSLPLYVFLLFLVGIPLGAIIRKGGFGLPFVFGLLIYTTFYMLAMIGKSLGEDGIIPPWAGAWLPVVAILPLVVYLLILVNRQSEFVLGRWIRKWVSRLGSALRKQTQSPDAVVWPGAPKDATFDWAVSQYPLQKGILFYKKHEPDFDKFFRFLEDLLKQTGADEITGYWKPDDDFKRRHRILGDVLMINITPDQHLISTNLDINYRYTGQGFEPVLGRETGFVPYTRLL